MKNEDIFRKYVFEVMKMWITLLAAVMIMAAYFLILYGGVGFVQDKRFLSSAPKENLAAIPDTKERFRGAHIIGWLIIAAALLTFLGAAALAIGDGIKNDFGFLQFFVRFLVFFIDLPGDILGKTSSLQLCFYCAVIKVIQYFYIKCILHVFSPRNV